MGPKTEWDFGDHHCIQTHGPLLYPPIISLLDFSFLITRMHLFFLPLLFCLLGILHLDAQATLPPFCPEKSK